MIKGAQIMDEKDLDSSVNEYEEQYKSNNYANNYNGIWLLDYKK